MIRAVIDTNVLLVANEQLIFDVYDRAQRRFWSTRRRDELAASAGLATAGIDAGATWHG